MTRFFLFDFLCVDDACSHLTQSMSHLKDAITPRCERCGQDTRRLEKQGIFAIGNGPRNLTGRFDKPIEMMSVALDDDAAIADFRERNPTAEVSSTRGHPLYGVPIAHTRQEKMEILTNEGYAELN